MFPKIVTIACQLDSTENFLRLIYPTKISRSVHLLETMAPIFKKIVTIACQLDSTENFFWIIKLLS